MANATQVQRVFQIVALKTKQDAASGVATSHGDVMRLWNSKVKVSTGEAVTEAFVDAAMIAFARVLKHDSLLQHVLAVPFFKLSFCALEFSSCLLSFHNTVGNSKLAGRGALWQGDAVGQHLQVGLSTAEGQE